MSVFAGPEIINSGLVLCLDAGNTKSYPGSGTNWIDISVNANTATLFASPTYASGAITFNPSSTGQYANIPVSVIPSGNLVSICCWINLGNPGTPPAGSVFTCSDSGNARIINIHLPWSDSIVYWDAGSSGGTYDRINTTTLTLAQKTGWHYWAFTKNATTGNMIIYLDGVSIVSGTGKTRTLGTTSVAASPCAIASFQGSANWNGSVSNFTIYNRDISDAEIQQNFNALRGRFGI